MRRATRNGVIAFAASGAMAVTVPAYAGSTADGGAADSPGLLAGNTVQVPLHAPVNVCGNTVNVVGLLNPALGNECANVDGGRGTKKSSTGAASAEGTAKKSPGVVSGNVVELPVHLPVNVSGNSVNVIGVGNAAVDNESVNISEDRPNRSAPKRTASSKARQPRTAPPAHMPHGPEAALAYTGAEHTVPAVAGAAALILGGAVLYRRRPRAMR